jgi:4-hydroxy-tetrahydrodipicolinate synthase
MNRIATPSAGGPAAARRRAGFSGVLVPVLTPFTATLEANAPAFVAFCRHLLAEGAGGLAVFGTTSEANSLSLVERRHLLAELVQSGIAADRLMPGTGAAALPDAVALTSAAVGAGAGGVLLLPPFYYKNVSEDGVFAWYAEVIERVGDARLRVYLYHIPQMSGVPITLSLIARLRDRYGEIIAGLKDSGGDWQHTERLLKEFADLTIFPGSERFLRAGLAYGAAGCISATANVNLRLIRAVIDARTQAERERLDQRMVALRAAYESVPVIPALKYVVAERTGDRGWRTVRPPLTPLPEAEGRALLARLGAAEPR